MPTAQDTSPTSTTSHDRHWSWECSHEQCEVRSKVNAAGVLTHVRQCMRCGRSLGAVKRVGDAPAFDVELRDRVEQDYRSWSDARARRYQMQMNERVIARERERQQRRSDYYQYIQGSVWRRKRALALRRCHGVCESCGEAPATQVHHTAYPEDFGDEPLWDLRGVCRRCHELIHGIRP